MQITDGTTISPATPLAADPASGITGTSNSSRLKQACQQFEGQFFALMLQEMRKTVPKDTLLGDDGHADEIFTGMMDDQIAQDMAKHGGPNDLSAQLYKQLSGISSPPAASSTPASLGAEEPIAAQAAAASSSPSPDFGRGGQGARANTGQGAKATPEDKKTSR